MIMSLTKVALLLLLTTATFSLTGIGLNPIKPAHLNKGIITKYLFSIVPQVEILTKAKIKITFPSEFRQSDIAANLECMASSLSYGWKFVPCIYYIDSVIVDFGTVKDETTYILIGSPRNPVIYSMSSYFSICLMYDQVITDCNKQFGKVVFPDSQIITTSTSTYPSVYSLNSPIVGQSSTYQFTFSLSKLYQVGNTVKVTFPKGFMTSSNPVCQMSGTYNQVIKTFVWPDNRTIQCQSINKTIYLNQTLKIIGIYNPNYEGTFGTAPNQFKLEILSLLTTIVLEQITLQMTVNIVAGTLVGSLVQTNNFILSKSKYTFYVSLQNPIQTGNYIRIRFNKTWILYSDECSVISGLVLAPNTQLSCKNSTDSQYTYLNISKFLSASVSTQLVFSIFVGSPQIVGLHNIEVITANENGVLDRFSLSASLNSTYGMLNMLSINAITANSKVPVAGTGPLQLTFFLNYKLPQTNVLTSGKFLLRIYPQIPLPPPLINGVLKCFFFNTIPASNCNWDTTNPSYTLVTINTPLTVQFQYSQIPITITTEGAVNSSMIGITIADKVTRYRFQLEAYKQTNSTTPTQVYYSQYIADALSLSLTTTVLTSEINEYTHLKFTWVNPYNFVTGFVDDVRLKIQFLGGGGWASSLGYLPNTVYKDYPCVYSDNANAVPSSSNPQVRCDLYTYLSGPHSSLTSTNKGPYLLVYGFVNNMAFGNTLRLQIGKFLIGSTANVQTKIRFSIIQQTPTMLTQYVELYYTEFVAFTTVAQRIATPAVTGTSSSLNNSQINILATHTISSPSVTTGGYAVIYQFDMTSTPSFTDYITNCSATTDCVYLGYPVNWVVEYIKTGTFSTSITSTVKINNGAYAGTFDRVIRVFQSSLGTIYKATFNGVYTSVPITSATFSLAQGAINKGWEIYYNVIFTAKTTTPSNGFIRFTFGNGVQLSALPYCSPTSIGILVDELGLLCTNENSYTIKIYNIDGLTAGTQYQIKVRLASLQNTSGTIQPTVNIRTYYSLSVDTSIVDQITALNFNTLTTNNYQTANKFEIISPRMSLSTPRVGYVGKIQIMLRPSSLSLSAQQIIIKMHNHQWNGGVWTTPNNALGDPLVCLLNNIRVGCTFTLSPLIVTMNVNPAGLSLGSDNTITLDTEYIYPQNGIKHPANGGDYLTSVSFYYANSSLIEETSFYHKVLAKRLRTFYAYSTVNEISAENLFKFEFEVDTDIYPAASDNGIKYSKIWIQFPTVDYLGNVLFASDLGGYTYTGEYVGCHFWSSSMDGLYIGRTSGSKNLKCRLIKSEVSGDPVKVEIINHEAFSASAKRMKVYMARIFNPAIAVTSIQFKIRIQHVTAATNHIDELYDDYFDLFMNTKAQSILPVTSTSCYTGSSGTFQDGFNSNDIGWFRFYPQIKGSTGIDSVNGFYYVLRLPADLKPINRQDSAFDYCGIATRHMECMVFPQINYIIAQMEYNNYQTRIDVQFPQAITQNDTIISALVWQNGRNLGVNELTITSSCYSQLYGTLTSVTITQIGSGNSLRKSRRRQQVQVSFTTQNILPATGTVQIVWPAGVVKAYPHCRSMTNLGSKLTAVGGSYNGEIGCLVQSTRTWVITSFQALPAGSRIIIHGYIDFPTSYHYLGYGEIITYNNTDSYLIRNAGYIIDMWTDNYFSIYIQNYQSMNINTEMTLEETLPLRISHVGPLQFKFKLASNFQGPNLSTMQVKLSKLSITGISGGFSYNSANKYVCSFTHMDLMEQYGCIITSIADDNTTGSNVIFTIVSSTTLVSTATFKFILTTLTGVAPQGISYPTQPGTYKVDVNFDTDQSGLFAIHNHLYIEVYGTPFSLLSITSFVTMPSQKNLIWVKLSPTTQIEVTQQIVIEIPTKSSANLNLFSSTLGLSLNDGDFMPVDVIDATFVAYSQFMQCRFFKGDQTNYKPVRIICGKFAESIQSGQTLFFAFKIVNPSISQTQISIPFMVYSVEPGNSYKKNFNLVENAVFLRSNVYSTRSDVGQIYSNTQRLQTPSSNLYMITRHYQNIYSGDSLVIMFNFPLRVNGKITNGCAYNSTYFYGDAYYHQNLWVVVCVVTTYTIGVPGNGGVPRNLYISGFYTPWYYLSSSQRVVEMYAWHATNNQPYSQKGYISDLYPNESPRRSPNTPTFAITPLHQTTSTIMQGSRDDYRIDITFASSATVDIAYMKRIAIIFPSGFDLFGGDCMEDSSSQIEVADCFLNPAQEVIYVRPVYKSGYTSNLKLSIKTNDLGVASPVASTFNLASFMIKYYSWENITQPSIAPLSDNNYAYLIIDNIGSSTYTLNQNPAGYGATTPYSIYYPHQRYFKTTPYNSLSHRAPIEFEFIPHTNFPTATGNNFHTIKVTYPSSFGDYISFFIRDLQVFKTLCYLNNIRIRRCTIDTTNNWMIMNFQFSLSSSTKYHVLFSIIDPRNPDINGFLSSVSTAKIRLQYSLATNATINYIESDMFQTLVSLPTGTTVGPFSAITAASVEYGNTLRNVENVVNIKLTFNRTDITALVFQIPTKDSANNDLYSTSTVYSAAFYNVNSGEAYPCSNNGLGAGGSVKCFLIPGALGNFDHRTRIVMTDFTYVSQMNCRFIFKNGDVTNSYYSINVEAYGGVRSSTNLYGDIYMGQWQIPDIFQISSTAASTASYTSTSYRLPSQSPWRDNTIHYAFSRNSVINANRMSMAKFTLYDSSTSYFDKCICQAKLGSANFYDDLLTLNFTSGGNTYSYAYFVTTWQGNTDVSYGTASGWGLKYLKCRFYSLSYTAYFFFSNTDVQIVTLSYNQAHLASLATGFTTPISKYFDLTNRVMDGTVTHCVGQIDITPTINSVSNFFFQNGDAMYLAISFTGTNWWGSISSCHVLGGILSTNPTQPSQCRVVSATLLLISNVAGFVSDPYLSPSTNKRIKFKFAIPGNTADFYGWDNDVYTTLYANYDAYNNAQLSIFNVGSSLYNPCYYPNQAYCYIIHQSRQGSATIHELSDTFIRVSILPDVSYSFNSGNYGYQINLQFSGFTFGGSCSITSIIMQQSLSNTPGTGVNNTIATSGTGCTSKRIYAEWNTNFANNYFANLFGNPGSFDGVWSTTQYLIFYITIAPSANFDLPILHHEYAFMAIVFNYWLNGQQWGAISPTRVYKHVNTQPLANSATFTTLTNNRGGVTELMLQLKGLQRKVGSTYQNYLLLVEFLSSSGWTTTSDPFTSYINTALNDTLIACKCLSAIGPLSSSPTSPFVDATCRRRSPTATYNAYAILIDHSGNVNEDLRCYFPQFTITTGMSIQAEVKVVYGNSYPPDLTSSMVYGSIYRVTTSPALTFVGSTPTMSLTSMSFSQGINFYGSSVVVGSSYFTNPYTVVGSWGSTLGSAPYIYINYNKGGPIPVFAFCADGNVFAECRVYNSLINVVIAKLKSSSITTFTMSRGSSSISYPTQLFSPSAIFNAVVYVGATSWVYAGTISRDTTKILRISNNVFTVVCDKHGSTRSSISNIIIITMSTQGQTLYSYIDTGSKIEVTYPTLTQSLNCAVWVQNQPNVRLTCQLSSGLVRIYSRNNDYTTSNNIVVSVGITNPTTASIAFTMIMYNYYYSSSLYSTVISTATNLVIDNSYASNTLQSSNRMKMYPFQTRISMTSNTPLRLFFQLASTGGTFSFANTCYFQLTYSQFQYSSAFRCILIERLSTNLVQETQRNRYPVDCTVSSTTLTVSLPKPNSFSYLTYFELVVTPVGITLAGCNLGGCVSQTGFHQTNFDSVNFVAFSSPSSVLRQQINKIYAYQGTSRITLQQVYILGTQPGVTSFNIQFNLNFNSALSFPSHYVEIAIWDLSLSAFTSILSNNTIPCQLSSSFSSINNRNPPQCMVKYFNYNLGYIKIRIENIGPIVSGLYWIAIDDVAFPTLTTTNNNKKVDFSISFYTPSTNLKYESFFKQVLLVDASNTVVVGSPSATFVNPSLVLYGAPNTGQITFTWPFDSTSPNAYQNKISLKIQGGYSATWSDVNSITFSEASVGTYQLLWVNKKLNKFIFNMPLKPVGATTLYFNSIFNPYPYQKEAYNLNNNMAISFYNNFLKLSTQTFTQPLFNIYAKNPAIVYVSQNLPSNTFDIYPTTNRFSASALTKLLLIVQFDQTAANIINRNLDILEIEFTSGLNWIEDCRIMKTSLAYTYQLGTCQTYYDGNWHIFYYGVTLSDVNSTWNVQIIGTYSSNSLTYISRLKAANSVVEYENTNSLSVSSYNGSRTIPTTLSWLNRRYFKNYYENQYKFLEAISPQSTTPYLRVRFTIPISFDGSGDFIKLYLPSSSSTGTFTSKNTVSLICTFLPAQSNHQDFSVGIYSNCYKDTAGNHIYVMYGPVGGLTSTRDYLMQIQQSNVVTTQFYTASAPRRDQIAVEIYRNEGNDYWSDTAFIHSYASFRNIYILHTTTTVGDYDTLSINYKPYGSYSAGSSSQQIILRLDISGLYFAFDGGLKAIYSADGKSIESGARFSENVGNPSGNEVTTIRFAQYSNSMSPLRISLSGMNAYTDNTWYVWRIPLLKNPTTAFTALRYNVSLIMCGSGTYSELILNKHQSINQYYTVADSSSSFSTSIGNTNRNVQTVSNVDLFVNIPSSSLSNQDVAIFKLDNSQVGISSAFQNPNDTSNYNYYYFPYINMVMAQKKTSSLLQTIGIGSASSSLNYQRTFGLSWVRIFDTSMSRLTTNPYTIKYSTPPSLTLNALTTYAASSIANLLGSERQGSTAIYQIQVTVPIIVSGGYIKVEVDPSLISPDTNSYCRVGTNFVRSTSDSDVMRCYRVSNGYIISGFTQTTAGTNLQIFISLKSIASFSSQPIAIKTYGIYLDTTSLIATANIANTITHVASSYPTTLYRIQKIVTPYYSSIYNNFYYQIEGSFNTRTLNFTYANFIQIQTPFTFTGNSRLIMKLNSTSVPGWTQLTSSTVSSTVYTFTIPPQAANDLTMYSGQDYIWKWTSYYSSWSNSGQYNGLVTSGPGAYNFNIWLNVASTWQDSQRYQFITQPKPQLLTIENRYPAAGKKTMLRFNFALDVNVVAGDFFEFTFDTNNLLADMFSNDVEGQTIAVGETYRYVDCREFSTNNYISNSRLICILYLGNNLANPPTPAKLSITLLKNINALSNPTTISVMFGNVKNPSTVGMNVGVQMASFRTCDNSRNLKCPYFRARGFYVTKSSSQNTISTATSFTTNKATILDTSATHTFQFITTANIGTSDIIYIIYPQNFQGVMPNDCSATNYNCYVFPIRRWVVLYPTTTISSGTVTINISPMNNPYYAQPFSLNFIVTISRGSGSSLGDMYSIAQPAFTTVRASRQTSTASSMTIVPTQTPNIFLRNYANTAIFTLKNIFVDSRITNFYIKAPSDVTSWDTTFCNATLTTTISNNYPYRFTCQVFAGNTSFLQIIRNQQFQSFVAGWNDYQIRVQAKFTIADFTVDPTLYVTTPTTSGLFYGFGSVNSSSSEPLYYLSECSNTIQISQHQVPIISDINFNQKSFAYRVGQVNNKQIFYLLAQPRGTTIVATMVFTIPTQFNYPGVFKHDSCLTIGRNRQSENNCLQSRENGKTLVKLTPTNYNNQVKIIQLGSVLTQNWFTAPSLPGNFYNMTVQFYDINGILLEKQNVNISPVYGQSFDIPSISITNTLDPNLSESIYNIQFVTGSLQIPPGASTTATTLVSQLQFIFESYNAADSSNVFLTDLGTGLKEGNQIGCVFLSGLKALAGKRLKCLLHVGTNSTDKPKIRIINYDYINPSTTIKVAVGGIQALQAIKVNTISIAVDLFYTTLNSETYLYMPTPKLPVPTSSVSRLSQQNASWHSNWLLYTSFSGVNVVLKPTTFNLTFKVASSFSYNYSSLGSQHQYVLIKFTPKILIDPNNILNVSCASCSQVQVFYAAGIVLFRHTTSTTFQRTILFTNFPTSAYKLENSTVGVKIQFYDNYQKIFEGSTVISGRTVEKCTLFNFGVVSVSSLNGGQIGVTYVFSIQTNHFVPAYAALSITIPSQYGDMVSNNVVCTLSGFQSTNAYCLINTPSRVDIYTNGTQLLSTGTYYVKLSGLQNPNIDSSNLTFYATSYYDSNIYLGRKICQNQVTPPTIKVKAVRTCTLEWTPSYYNQYFNATYVFFLSCGDIFRGDSTLYIKLPNEYSSQTNTFNQYCRSYESTTLVSQSCTLGYVNGTYMLITKIDATSQTSLSIVTNFINPRNSTYTASAFVVSKGSMYAQSLDSSITILSNSYFSASKNSVFLMNSPKEGGLLSTYIFKISPITSFTPQSLAVTFPTNFYINSGSVTVGIYLSSNSNLFLLLNYNNIQNIVSNVSAVDGQFLTSLPSFSIKYNTVDISNITASVSRAKWTYVFITGIKNPSKYVVDNFVISYYKTTSNTKALDWVYYYPLTYFISTPPNFLTLTSVQVSDKDLLYPSVYTFAFRGPTGLSITVINKQISYIVVIPTFYQSTSFANTAPVCKFNVLNRVSPCVRYSSQIVITQTFTATYNQLTLSVSTILNPLLPTYCNTTDNTLLANTYFRVRILDVISNTFLFETSSIVNGNNCIEFKSIRIPISLEYPLVMVAGLVYNITYGLTKPASNLKITAYTSANGFSFSPATVNFNDFYTLHLNTTIFLRSDIPSGTYTINFNKFQSQTQTYFRNILPITITVIDFDPTTATIIPTISIPTIQLSTVGYPVNVSLIFSLPTSTPLTFFITIDQQNNSRTLSQYSPSLANFTLSPRIINILPQTSNYSFTISNYQQVVPPYLTLRFKITSLYSLIHKLTTPVLYLCFDRDPKFNVMYPPLRISLLEFASQCSANDVGKSVTNIFVSNDTSKSSSSSLNPQIIQIKTTSVSSTSATIVVHTRSPGMVYFVNTDAGDPQLNTSAQIITPTQTTNTSLRQSGSSYTQTSTVYNASVAQLNNLATITLTSLSSSTKYDFYAVVKSQLGVSKISSITFTTQDLSLGVMMKIAFNDIVTTLDIVKSLQRIMRISPFRIKVLTSNYELELIRNSINSFKNSPKYTYQVVIAPDPTNDLKTPTQIVNTFIKTPSDLILFKTYLPNWDNSTSITYHELRPIQPKVMKMPTPLLINLYNVTFQMTFWQRVNVYAILIQQRYAAKDTFDVANIPIIARRVSQLSSDLQAKCPTSNQIRKGKDNSNNALNSYKYYAGTTNSLGLANIFFNDLKPGSTYDMYITSSSMLPYQPTFLWQDKDAIKVSFSTLRNPNLSGSNKHIDQLKIYQPKLATAISNYLINQQKKKNIKTANN